MRMDKIEPITVAEFQSKICIRAKNNHRTMSKLVDKYKYDLFLQIDVSDIYELYIYIELRHVFTN